MIKYSFFRHKKIFICPGAFSQVYTYPDGSVYLCPDCMMSKKEIIGNLYENSFEEIWNSPKAQSIRKQILKGNYANLCNPRQCHSKSNFNNRFIPNNNIEYKAKQKKFPKMVCIGADSECNTNCIMCRPKISRLTRDELQELNKKIDTIYLPMLKDAEELTLSNTSDPFGSRNTRLLLKKASDTYPKLKFNILTNGLLFDKFNCDDTGITNRISNVMFSIHGGNEETYKKIVPNGNFEIVKRNLKWASSLKEKKEIKGLYLAFVITSLNYKNIPQFIEFAKENNAVALFWHCVDWGGNLENTNEPLAIANPSSDKFKDFMNIINSIELETEYSHFSLLIRNLKENYEK